MEALAVRADAIVVAEVAERGYVLEPSEGRVSTVSRLLVGQVVAGDAPAELLLRQSGGRVGDDVVVVPGQPSLLVGERYLLFLRVDGSNAFLVAMERGACRLTPPSAASGNGDEQLFGEATVAVAAANGTLHTASPTCNGESLAALAQRIRAAREVRP